jgi:hypothetical protein
MSRVHPFACLLLGAATLTLPLAAQSNLPRTLVWEQALRGSEEQELRWPVAVAASSAEELAVADAFEPRLMIFVKVGVSWQLRETVPLPEPPAAIAWDGRRYVATLRHGGGLVALDGPQLAVSQLDLPSDVVPGSIGSPRDGTLLVHDSAGERILRLSARGEIDLEVPIDGHVTALASAPDGGFYTAEAQSATIRRHNAEGLVVNTFEVPGEGPVPAWPVAIAVDAGGSLAVVDRHGARLLLFDGEGRAIGVGSRKGWEPGLLLRPRAVTFLPGGRLLVADEGNGRAQIFRRSDRGAGP